MKFQMKIFDIFHLQSGQTAFVGLISGEKNLLQNRKAELLIDNKKSLTITIDGEFLMDRRHPDGPRAISTTDCIELTSNFVREHDCKLIELKS